MKNKIWVIMEIFTITIIICFSGFSFGGVINNSDQGVNVKINKNENSKFAPGEIIIKFKETSDYCVSSLSTGLDPIDNLNTKNNLLSINNVKTNNAPKSFSNIFRFTFPEDKDVITLVDEYSMDPNIEYVEPNYYCFLHEIPNDPSFGLQWSFNQDTDCDVDAPEAWDIETGNEDVIIAVLDTGVEINHSDISDNIWINSDEIGDNGIDDDNNGFVDDVNGWNFAYGGINDVWDNQGHGTHCAGVIGAVGNNNKGVAGLCWNCKIMPVRVLPDGPMPIHILAEGVFYAIENGARVISMSLGIYGYSRYLEDLFYYADSKGVICIASAGNDDTYEVQYPSGYEEVISVAATDQNDERAFFSNYGSSVDIAAPGVEIYSLDNYNSYYVRSGTSMAAPHIAGAAGLILSKKQDITPDMFKTMIYNSADQIDTDKYIGRGRLNVYEALKRKPAVSLLDRFTDSGSINGLFEITGSSWGEGFEYYKLHIKNKDQNGPWVKIKESYSSVDNGCLGVFDTTCVIDGRYIIRLTTVNFGEENIDQIEVIVNNEIVTLYVGGTGSGNYSTIQEAINDAEERDVVFVYNGVYNEFFTVDESIDIVGENNTHTVIDITDYKGFINISAEWVKLSNFCIINSNIFSDTYGIQLFSDNCEISNNRIILHYGGIYLYKTKNFRIFNNYINEANTPIYGSFYSGFIYNNIFDNTGSSYGSISLVARCCSNEIYNNKFENGSYGIRMNNKCNYNIIRNNQFINYVDSGIAIDKFKNRYNYIYLNNFINTGYDESVNDGSGNFWDNGKYGNYYDYYTGIDVDGDGIGDTPYTVSNQYSDNFPLMTAWQIDSNPPSKPSRPDGPTECKKNTPYDFSTSSIDPDGDKIKYGWDWDGDNFVDEWTYYGKSGENKTILKSWSKRGYYTVKVKAKDSYGFQSPWSDSLSVHLSKSKATNTIPLFQKFFQQHPNLFPLLKMIIKLLGFQN